MKNKQIIDQFTLEEKCRFVVGLDSWHTYPIPRLDIPSIMMCDGPHGLRKQYSSGNSISVEESYPAVCYPPAVNLASTFQPKLAYLMGNTIAKECRNQDVSLLLGPGMNIKRNPLCGRNFEYFSEDPYVTSQMAEAFVKGVQKENVGSCVKHFALNQQETSRMQSSSMVDLRTKRELYYRAFEDVIKADPDFVMCSYNKVDGVYASENQVLLKETLRDTFEFQKVIVSDWTAVMNRTKALQATLDLEMPGHEYSVKQLLSDLKKGVISESELDESVDRLLSFIESKRHNQPYPVDLDAHHQIAKEIAIESMVLLKNEDQFLPLSEKQSVAIIGKLAKEVRYQGAGSSHIHSYHIDELPSVMPKNVDFSYADGYKLVGDGYDQGKIQEAVHLAKNKDVVILVLGLTEEYESEGYDRTHLSLPLGHILLLEAIYKVNPNIVCCLQMGSPIEMPWRNLPKAIMNCYLGGEASQSALVDLLYGKANPSGRLAETFAEKLSDIPSTDYFAKGNDKVYYQEGLYVGYRYFESIQKEVAYPFGFGLSYTTFDYANIEVHKEIENKNQIVEVTCEVLNSGSCYGQEVVQCYVSSPMSRVYHPIRELKAFEKIGLEPGASTTVRFTLSMRDFSYFDIEQNQFDYESGDYLIQIGKNAHDILLESKITLTNENDKSKDVSKIIPSYFIQNGLTFHDQDFETLIQKKKEPTNKQFSRPFTIENTVEDLKISWIGRQLKKIITKQALSEIKDKPMVYQRMVIRSLLEIPLRSIVVFSGGKISMNLMLFVVELSNRRVFRAIKYLLKGDLHE